MSQPRPALRRAADADVHPALVVVPDTVSPVIDLTDGSAGQPQTKPDRLLNLPEQEPASHLHMRSSGFVSGLA